MSSDEPAGKLSVRPIAASMHEGEARGVQGFEGDEEFETMSEVDEVYPRELPEFRDRMSGMGIDEGTEAWNEHWQQQIRAINEQKTPMEVEELRYLRERKREPIDSAADSGRHGKDRNPVDSAASASGVVIGMRVVR